MTSIEEFEQLQPGTFVRIEKVTVENDQQGGTSFEIVLAPDAPASEERLVLLCEGVRNLTLRKLDPGQWCTLMIEDLSERRWEDLSYLVADVEEEVVSLYCRHFTAALR